MKSFTLIELVIVVTVLAILAFSSHIALNSYRVHHLRAAAERIAGDLRYAKNMAISSTTWTGAVFLVAPTNSYSLYQTDGSVDTLIKNPQDIGQDYVVNLAGTYQDVVISGVDIGNGNKVEFDPYGAPYIDKNGTALNMNGIITLSNGSATAVICIEPTTGKISIQ